MFISIRKKQLSIRRKDFKQKLTNKKTGKVSFQSPSYRLTRSDLNFYVENNLQGFVIIPRYSFVVELRESYRGADKKPKAKIIWRITISEECVKSNFHEDISRRDYFWKNLDKTLSEQNLDSASITNICQKVEAVVPRLTNAELEKYQVDLAKHMKWLYRI